jgi:hypothetical protein
VNSHLPNYYFWIALAFAVIGWLTVAILILRMSNQRKNHTRMDYAWSGRQGRKRKTEWKQILFLPCRTAWNPMWPRSWSNLCRLGAWRVVYAPALFAAAMKRMKPTAQPRKPDDCFQGSTDFYDSPDTDEFTPSYLEAGRLSENAGTRSDGTIPPWIDTTSTKPPVEQYVEWFNGIWHSGDPSDWTSSIFTSGAVLIDPSGRSTGAEWAAATFIRLFRYFPDLRGEVVSWAANERELFINWRFKIQRRGNRTPLLVAVVDKFCFVDGRISFRLANFDIITLAGYLSENFGADQVYEFLAESIWQAPKTGGMQLLPGILWNLIKGIFLWQPPCDPARLTATPGDGNVSLQWTPIQDAVSYRLYRATDLAGPYILVKTVDASVTRFADMAVINGVLYWYLIVPNFRPAKLMPVSKRTAFVASHSMQRRMARAAVL